METVSELITQSDGGMTNVLEWITQLANTATGPRFLGAKKYLPVFYNAGPSSHHYNGDEVAAVSA